MFVVAYDVTETHLHAVSCIFFAKAYYYCKISYADGNILYQLLASGLTAFSIISARRGRVLANVDIFADEGKGSKDIVPGGLGIFAIVPLPLY